MLCIGIPRALLFYQYYPLWATFFQALGAEVIISPQTNRQSVLDGTASMVPETCLPVKVYCGHIHALKGKVDYIFIPAIRSVDIGAYNCAKFLGLPDLMKATVADAPPFIEMDIDVNEGTRALYEAIYHVGRYLTWNPLEVKRAFEAAWQVHKSYQRLMQGGLMPLAAMEEMGMLNGQDQGIHGRSGSHPTDARLTIAVIGHPYIVYDGYINHDTIGRLQAMGARVVTYEMAPEEGVQEGILRLTGEHYWTYEGEMVGACGYYLAQEDVDGIIAMAAFGCGPDSVMLDIMGREARKMKKAFMALIVDEHTGEAGLVTRLEAFIDMLERRKRARG